MNKAPIAIMICILNCVSCFAAEPTIFSRAQKNNDSIVVTFNNSGPRYLIELNGERMRINEYGQNLTFNKADRLKLSEKHHSYLIRNIQKDNKDCLKIEETGIDLKSGKEIKNEYYLHYK